MRYEISLQDLYDEKERIELEIVKKYREVMSLTVTFPTDDPNDVAETLSDMSYELNGLADELDTVKNEIEHLEEVPE